MRLRVPCGILAESMRVVAPRDGWPSQKAIAMAMVLDGFDEAGHFEDVATATADCHFTFATTARARGLTKQFILRMR